MIYDVEGFFLNIKHEVLIKKQYLKCIKPWYFEKNYKKFSLIPEMDHQQSFNI